ncbi:MAG: PAS domain-containing protein, partial [Burkholderiales bacterium]
MADAEITTDKRCRVILLNGEAERLTGWRTLEAMGKPLSEVLAVLDPLTGQRIGNVVERILRKESILFVSRNGVETALDGSVSPLRDSDGKISGAILKFSNADEALPGSFIDRLKEGIFQTDACGRLTFLNRAWEEITHYRVEDCLGKPIATYIHPMDIRENAEQMRLLEETGHCRYEVRFSAR